VKGEKWRFRLPRKSQGFFTCRKSATWGKLLYFPSEGRHAEDFSHEKIRRLWPGLNPRTRVLEASMLTTSMLTTRPPKPLVTVSLSHLIEAGINQKHKCFTFISCRLIYSVGCAEQNVPLHHLQSLQIKQHPVCAVCFRMYSVVE
jgi:hypothetical protein